MKKDYYKQTSLDVIKKFNSSINGLSEETVNINRKKYGDNTIEVKKRRSTILVFIDQFKNLLVMILILASILSLFTGGIENTFVILFVLILNALLGTIQYCKAEKSLDALKKLSITKAKVLRNNQIKEILSNDVVVGDILVLKSGEVISCDCRIIEASHLEVDESILTGESITSSKSSVEIENDVVLAERKNCLYRGCKIVSGKAKAVCFSVGFNTEIGRIAKMIGEVKKEKSPLEKDIDKFSRQLAILIITVCISVFFLNLYRHISLLDSLMFAISLAVAAIPEALQTIVTICLAISTEKMAKEKAVIKDIKAIETLGNVNIIATDKTGTITQNKMQLKYFFDYQEKEQIEVDSLFSKGLILCNDSSYMDKQLDTINTDLSILLHYQEKEVNEMISKYPRLDEIPFNSTSKKAYTLHEIDKNKTVFCKGGSEVILDMVSFYTDEFNNIISLNLLKKEYFNKIINEYSAKGYRVLGLAYQRSPEIKLTNDYILLGFIMLYDPPKEKVKEAIKECLAINVKPVMITGDHLLTALSIAKEVGIFKENDLTLTGNELSNLSEEEFLKIIDQVSVYARVTPLLKLRIIETLQKKNHSVAMIGDGVNDAPALKKADVGVSMGISGTDVSKEASQVILLDDNYQTIVSAIKRGRRVYKNIQNAILFLIAGNMAGIFLVLYTSFLNLPTPFAPVHLLFINLINDSLPAIAIGIDESRNQKFSKPRAKNNPILTSRVIKRIFVEGLLIAISAIISYYIGLRTSAYHARTCVFITITVTRLLYSFNCRGRFSIFKMKKLGKNITLRFSIIIGLILVNCLLFIDYLHPIFQISNLMIKDIVLAYLLSIIPVLIIQILFMFREYKTSKLN